MKLRTTHNSIRIRIRKSELTTLEKEGRIEESIRFVGGALFRFGLKLVGDLENIQASLKDNYLEVQLPQAEAERWMKTNQVGMETWNDLENGERLHLLIEKDFPCVDREDEDKNDTFWELADKKPDVC